MNLSKPKWYLKPLLWFKKGRWVVTESLYEDRHFLVKEYRGIKYTAKTKITISLKQINNCLKDHYVEHIKKHMNSVAQLKLNPEEEHLAEEHLTHLKLHQEQLENI